MIRLRPRRLSSRLRSPFTQLVAAIGFAVGGAALIGLWMVGVMFMVGGLLLATDALLRDIAGARPEVNNEILERYRRSA